MGSVCSLVISLHLHLPTITITTITPPPEEAKAEPRTHLLCSRTRWSFLWNTDATEHQSKGFWLPSWAFNMQSNEPQLTHAMLHRDRQMDGGIETQRADAETQLPTVEVGCTACKQLRTEEPEQVLVKVSLLSAWLLLFIPFFSLIAVKFEFSNPWMFLPFCHHLQVVNVAWSFIGWCVSVIQPGRGHALCQP